MKNVKPARDLSNLMGPRRIMVKSLVTVNGSPAFLYSLAFTRKKDAVKVLERLKRKQEEHELLAMYEITYIMGVGLPDYLATFCGWEISFDFEEARKPLRIDSICGTAWMIDLPIVVLDYDAKHPYTMKTKEEPINEKLDTCK